MSAGQETLGGDYVITGDLTVEGMITGGGTVLDWKDGVQTASTADVTLSGEQTINGVLTSTSRIGVTNQTDPIENGIYVTAAGAWTRATDADEDAEVTNGLAFLVSNTSSTKVGNIYIITTADPITVGVTGIAFTEHPSAITTHAASHTDGSDDIQDATAGQKGLATAAQITKLDAIESAATADQSDAEIKTAYENNADTNEFSDAEQSKLSGVESGATADQSDAEIETAYDAQVAAASQGEAEAGTEVAIRRFSPLRIAQAIAALETGGGGGGSALTRAVTQATHGLAVNDVIRDNGTIYVKAQADTAANATGIVGIVTAVAGANDFTYTSAGFTSTLTGLTDAVTHYLSEITAGLLTTTVPTGTGEVDQPVLFARSATEAEINIQRGQGIP